MGDLVLSFDCRVTSCAYMFHSAGENGQLQCRVMSIYMSVLKYACFSQVFQLKLFIQSKSQGKVYMMFK